MATRSRISIQNDNGTIDSIYCHWDGYPSYNGRLLLKYYSNEEKIRELIALGNISSLKEKANPNKDFEHSFVKPQDDVTIAYHRDRQEEFRMSKFINEAHLIGHKNKSGEEFNYLWKDNAWHISEFKTKNFVRLTEKMCEG